MITHIRLGLVAFVVAMLFIAVFAFVPNPHTAKAQTTSSIEEMLATIQSLLAQVQELQRQLNAVRGELRDTIKDGLQEGMSDVDIRKIQELLATDPEIYPEGLTTGYYGPLTRGALMRFQRRHELEVTGRLDEETKSLIEEYLAEKFGDKIPAGLLRAPGIRNKVERRYRDGCDDRRGMAFLCKKLKEKHSDADGSDDDSDDSDDSDDNDDSDEDEEEDEDEDDSDDSDDSDDDDNASSTDDGTDS